MEWIVEAESLSDFVDHGRYTISTKPLIRCRDCKYYRKYGYVNGKPKFLPKCTFNSIYVNADDFCSRAERKSDG